LQSFPEFPSGCRVVARITNSEEQSILYVFDLAGWVRTFLSAKAGEYPCDAFYIRAGEKLNSISGIELSDQQTSSDLEFAIRKIKK
jgi:hypothetical protein